MEDKYNRAKSDRYSKSVKAGKRTYFFDVKSTKDDNLYITITESKRKHRPDGDGFYYEKHKIFLYKEDLVKFSDGLSEVVDYVRKNNPTPVVEQTYTPNESEESASQGSSYSDVDFDDLGN
ncbi:MAG: DUF3276 family protein [Candidatus Competibacteraceae bacterium]|nr:DUF3276 family protein [Candidatus Competibacteraceae bacterium]